jgi:branched-chain amino acid transport system permease protein
MIRGRRLRPYAAVVVIGVILAAAPFAFGGTGFYLRLLSQMLLFMIYTVAFNLIFGNTRQLFLCLGALAGTAAYVSVVLTTKAGLPTLLTVPLGVLTAGVMGGVFSYVSVRRRLALMFVGIITLTFSLTFENLVMGLRDLTHGETGLDTSGLGMSLLEDRWTGYYAYLVLLVASLALYQLLVTSRVGVAFRALRDDELTAELAGIDVARYKVLAAFLGSGLLGLAGIFYAYNNRFVSPSVFSFNSIDVVVLVMLLFGGLATLLGPVLGGAVLTVVNEIVRPLGPLNVLVYGALLLVIFLFREGTIAVVQRYVRLWIPAGRSVSPREKTV